MTCAETFSKLSTARRLKVGAIVVKDDRIISIGYNGMPSGWDNCCEDEILVPNYSWSDGVSYDVTLKTKPEVLHAEANAITKLARCNESGAGASIFITHAPCIECAKLIYQSGITEVYYRDEYRNDSGIAFLERSGIKVAHNSAPQ